MGLIELFLAVLLVGISAVNAALPVSVWSRTRDPRFLFLTGANLGLSALGAIWVWGQLPFAPPPFTSVELPTISLVLLVAVLLLAATLWPRHA